mmetsp:Transcript_19802/g.55037  ORF Transcript_19802/g.55037 Transcript_19802/m.55037 type:complete len:93 (-) Transcript_19802:470-748(-)|eukprot:CAMPEP_0117651012 /NCGR_PEP_ID=MMETSP0804-20121206/1860_1 /TAXON_ID=1074897 /ORGANISM="Tetraselmis astigmatica, Strain CCMP880" /LENGTH=92 /DNA_ID=CAMNT_0005456951 /DNA_START=169 /DNA_END=447 /DNA_ORIENTATION=-
MPFVSGLEQQALVDLDGAEVRDRASRADVRAPPTGCGREAACAERGAILVELSDVSLATAPAPKAAAMVGAWDSIAAVMHAGHTISGWALQS